MSASVGSPEPPSPLSPAHAGLGRRLQSRWAALGLRPATAALGVVMLGSLAVFSGGLAGGAQAATMTFGSSLTVPATEDTANDLTYEGSNVQLPGSVFHIAHDGADGAFWNAELPTETPTAPASGQVISVSLEGCAKSNGPAPLTQIHFQTLAPQPGGGEKVELTSQAFDIPVCGAGGASGSTVSTYAPTNLCIAQGDYVDFNEEGGFLPGQNGPPPYPAGVPYEVIGAVGGASMDSFIRNNGAGNGAMFSPGDKSNHDGFASNPGEELLLQALLATGPDATPICPGGTKGAPPPGTSRMAHRHVFPTLTIPTPQFDGMNIRGVVQVAIFCHSANPCTGRLTLHSKPSGRPIWLGAARFTLKAHSTGKVRVHLSMMARHLVRANHGGGVAMSVSLGSDQPSGPTNVLVASIAVHGA